MTLNTNLKNKIVNYERLVCKINKIENIFILFFLICTGILAFIFLINVTSSGGKYVDESTFVESRFNSIWSETVYIMGINLFMQIAFYYIFFIVNFILYRMSKKKVNLYKMYIFCLANLFGFLWIVIEILLYSNGKFDLFWGPDDTGFAVMSTFSLVINYLYYKELK